jgi:hypothetical protein
LTTGTVIDFAELDAARTGGACATLFTLRGARLELHTAVSLELPPPN